MVFFSYFETEIDHVTKLLSEDELEAMHKTQTLNKKAHGWLREILWDILFLLLLISVVMSNQNSSVYFQNRDLRNTFVTGLSTVSTL